MKIHQITDFDLVKLQIAIEDCRILLQEARKEGFHIFDINMGHFKQAEEIIQRILNNHLKD